MSAKLSQNYFELSVGFPWGAFSARPFNVGNVDHNRASTQAPDYFPTLKGRGEKAPVGPAQQHFHIPCTQGKHKYFKIILTGVVVLFMCVRIYMLHPHDIPPHPPNLTGWGAGEGVARGVGG